MSALLVLTSSLQSSADVLPALALLPHQVRVLPADTSVLVDFPRCDAVLVDGRTDLLRVRDLTRLVRTTGIDVPLLLVVTEGGLAVVSADWGADDVLLGTAGPVELDARLRLAAERRRVTAGEGTNDPPVIRRGNLSIDEGTYTARLDGRRLDLTFKEFELLKHLAQHPGRVFNREQLLKEVWGYDYFGGSRTVDVHVRRLRAKLGTEHEALIGTVRNVGYRLVLPTTGAETAAGTAGVSSFSADIRSRESC
ncbi:MAG TPA: response regulator transcription factor [Nocardioidaceae bacterium]|nr:response regulator transcription factor [Nocardioidaceae bacterium]